MAVWTFEFGKFVEINLILKLGIKENWHVKSLMLIIQRSVCRANLSTKCLKLNHFARNWKWWVTGGARYGGRERRRDSLARHASAGLQGHAGHGLHIYTYIYPLYTYICIYMYYIYHTPIFRLIYIIYIFMSSYMCTYINTNIFVYMNIHMYT